MERLVVVGGGISGLATAFRARRAAAARGRALAVTVLEAGDRPGGRMWTDRTGGFAIEWGPNGFLDSKVAALDLARDLGAEPLLLRASELAKKRFICRDGALVRLPETPPAFLATRLLSRAAKLRVLAEPFAPPAPGGDETVADFAARRLGPEARDYLIDPMVSGIFAGDPSRVSLAAAFPRIVELERQYGGLFKGMLGVMRERRRQGSKAEVSAGPGGTLTSFRGGVLSMVEAAAGALGADLVTSAPVASLRRTATGWLAVSTAPDGTTRHHPADAVVLACPAYEAARLLRRADGTLASLLDGIPYAPVTVVATAYARDDLKVPLDGFGFLVPAAERRPILGTLWDSSVFPDRAPPGRVLLRSMMGGARSPDLAALPDDEAVRRVRGELRTLAGIDADPCLVRVYRHDRGIPQYLPGHPTRVAAIDGRVARQPGLFLCHNAYRGIALGDCCREADATADRIAAHLWGAAGR